MKYLGPFSFAPKVLDILVLDNGMERSDQMSGQILDKLDQFKTNAR